MKSLSRHEVRYLLIGGWAVGIYGHVRSTGDIDFWLAHDRENALRLSLALQDFGFPADAVAPAMIMQEAQLRFGVPPLRIEMLMELPDMDFDACFARREQRMIDGTPLMVIALPDLVASKRLAGRLKDLADLDELGQL